MNRTSDSSGASSVRYHTSFGTALDGANYANTYGLLTWASGDTSSKTFVVPILKKSALATPKEFSVSLSNPVNLALGSPSTATVTITVDLASSVRFSQQDYTVARNAGSVQLPVERTGSIGFATIHYETKWGSALDGIDFDAAGGILTWADGDTAPKNITVPILNPHPLTVNRTFTVQLFEPSSNVLTSGTSAAVTIKPANASGSGTGGILQLANPSTTVAATAGAVSMSVKRMGGSTGAVSVAYATSSGTAVAGTNFTATNGTLEWASGDSTEKKFSVAISNTTPFSGSKSFTVALSDPTGGVTLSNPSSASVAISGSSAGSTGPSAVTNLQLIDQGGPNKSPNAGGPSLTNYQQISWNAATPGTYPIASYNIYRNGVLYANTAALTYADTAATNSNSPTFIQPSTIYRYNVAAVDTQGNVGPQAAQMSVYAYHNGYSNWGKDDLSYDGATPNYASTAGNPEGGPFDISVYFPSGGFLPVVNPPQAPGWDLEIGAFNYFTIDINPGPVVSPFVQLIFQSRLPPGDDASWGNGFNVFDYGPAPVANTWATYKVPLSVWHFGISTFTGSISGTTLTVTAVSPNGMGAVDADGFITGPGIPAGTYVVSYHQSASIGTFTIAGPGINESTSIPSEQMTFQRTGLYKFGLQPNTNPVTMYFNNMGFTVN